MKITISNLASIISSIAACIAIYISLRSNSYAKKALLIAQRDEHRKKPILVASYIDGFKSTTYDESNCFYAFSIGITNKSDLPNTLARAELVLIYRHENDLIAKVVLPHIEEMPDIGALSTVKPLVLPAKIDVRQTISEWLIFKISKDHLKNCSIDGYIIRIRDSFGEISEVEPLIIHEILLTK
jgi:hypothetical protein